MPLGMYMQLRNYSYISLIIKFDIISSILFFIQIYRVIKWRHQEMYQEMHQEMHQ